MNAGHVTELRRVAALSDGARDRVLDGSAVAMGRASGAEARADGAGKRRSRLEVPRAAERNSVEAVRGPAADPACDAVAGLPIDAVLRG